MYAIFRSKITQLAILIIAASIGIYFLWSYILSFQTVTFAFNSSRGYVEITRDGAEALYPSDGQSIELKKDEYRMTHIGDNLEKDVQTIRIDDDTSTVDVNFSFTQAYLDELYDREKEAIDAQLTRTYPGVAQRYSLTEAKLYADGTIFGATLQAKDTSSDNSDTLRLLMQKKSNTWRVAATPTPVLTVIEYPDIPRDVLLRINQVR